MPEVKENSIQGFRNILVTIAALVIIIMGMYHAQSQIVLLLLSVFIAIIFSPVLYGLESLKVPRILAFVIVIIGVIAFLSLIGSIINSSIIEFKANWDNEYKQQVDKIAISASKFVEKYEIPIKMDKIKESVPDFLTKLGQKIIAVTTNLLIQTNLIFIIVVFMLLETSTFPGKLQKINFFDGKTNETSHYFLQKIKRYLAIKSITSFATALIVAVGLKIIGVHYPWLWGILTFFLNFIPSIGAIIAGIPVLMLTLIQFGVGMTIGVAVAYVLLNMAIGNFIEPRFMGKELGLSPLVVFLSLLFWGWVLGPIGMFLSVPLTMAAKIACDSREDSKWIGVLLGP